MSVLSWRLPWPVRGATLLGMPSPPASKLDHALDAAARGLRVFPQKAKIPGIKRWPDSASAKPATIEKWWARRPNADIGIALDVDTYVLDADSYEAVAAQIDLDLPRTLKVATDRGAHLYFKVPHELARQAAVCGVPGLEGKGAPGPVTWAGSAHPSGFVYRIVVDAPIADMPAWLAERIGPRRPRVDAGEATDAERADWARARESVVSRATPATLVAAEDARADLSLTLRALRFKYLPHLAHGWADRMFLAAAYLGPHVAVGALGLDDTIKELTAVFEECNTAPTGEPDHVLRSIERGLAMGARGAASL